MTGAVSNESKSEIVFEDRFMNKNIKMKLWLKY